MENQNPRHQFVGGVLSKNRNKSKPIESPDRSKGYQVVKDLDYFLNEVAKERRTTMDILIHNFQSREDSYDIIPFYEVQIEAYKRWYKHQLEEKDKEIKEFKKAIIDNADDFLIENGELRATIEEQKKEISHLNGQVKLYSGVYSTITNLERAIENLTQENNLLKQK